MSLRIWTPPLEREIDPAIPFDVIYAAQQEISQADTFDDMVVLASQALKSILPAHAALEGTPITVTTTRILHPTPEEAGELWTVDEAVHATGSYSSISFVNLTGWRQPYEFGIEIAPADTSSGFVYPLIGGTQAIIY